MFKQLTKGHVTTAARMLGCHGAALIIAATCAWAEAIANRPVEDFSDGTPTGSHRDACSFACIEVAIWTVPKTNGKEYPLKEEDCKGRESYRSLADGERQRRRAISANPWHPSR